MTNSLQNSALYRGLQMTIKHRRKFTREFKLEVLAEIAAGNSLAQSAREH
jgi:transposase-like protein